MADLFIAIDEDGYVLKNDHRTTDIDFAQETLKNLHVNEKAATLTTVADEVYFIEAFDAPYVAHDVYFQDSKWWLETPYELPFSFQLESLSVDEWDRFHGITDSQVPFVFSRTAQEKFFDLMDEFDDDSVTFQEKVYPIKSYWPERLDLQKSDYWENVYQEEKHPGWDLAAPAEALKDMLPRLKLPKSRILVLGCGEGHDAAHFAANGHVVTAVDFSPEAIARARNHYGHMSNLTFTQNDVFNLPSDWIGAFDIIFEHTCYCAVNPRLRKKLAKVWSQCLHDQGFLMGVFFTMEKPQGPPFGVTEWEIRQRLKADFHFIFWGRWKKSLPKRQGRELFLYASKKNKK